MFKRALSAVCATVLLLSLTVQAGFASSLPQAGSSIPTITIDVNSKGAAVPMGLLGCNHRVNNNGEGTWDVERGEIYPDFTKTYAESGITSFRYPGGTIGNFFEWRKAVGDPDTRLPQIGKSMDATPEVAYYGVDEACLWAEEVNSTLVYMYNFANGSAEDAKALIYYLNGNVDSQNEEEAYWANLRYQNSGHKDPYKIQYFELGNELTEKADMFVGWHSIPTGKYIGDDPEYFKSEHKNFWVAANGGMMEYTDEPAVEIDDFSAAAARSDGTANQVKYAKWGEIAPSKDAAGPQYQIKVMVGDEEWRQVKDLSTAAAADRVYTVEKSPFGQMRCIRFGDGVHGAIPTKDDEIKLTYVSKKDGFKQYVEQMKAAARSCGSDIQIYTCFVEPEFLELVQESDYDGIVCHPYWNSPASFTSTTTLTLDNNAWKSESKSERDYLHDSCIALEHITTDWVRFLQASLDQYKGSQNRERHVIVTEYGTQYGGARSDFTRTVSAAVQTVDQLIDFARMGMPVVQRMALVTNIEENHSGNGRPGQSFFDVDDYNGGKTVAGCSAKAWQVAAHGIGSYYLTCTMENEPTLTIDPAVIKFGETATWQDSYFGDKVKVPEKQDFLSYLASADEEGNVYLLVTNTSSGAQTGENTKIQIDVPGYQISTADVKYFWDQDIMKFNTRAGDKARTNLDVKSVSIDVGSDSFTYNLPYCSVVGFKLNKDTSAEWGIERGIIDKVTFDASAVCTRAQAVELLWKASGSHVPEDSTCPFEDVDPNASYYNAVLWAAEQGITKGDSSTTFGPDRIVTRAQVAVFLWRAAKVTAKYEHPFNDVLPGTYYYDAVSWGAEKGITNGTSVTAFSPDAPCLFGQLISSLYRYQAQ